mmetsp:Transcript_4973/g.15606  ORF Transcript_4973/g.15606 Transcript_4973/m.15606 type:complete len:212 (-) Transcript_4973:185-820(-)
MMLPVDVHGQTLTVDVDPDVELDHVVALEHRLVARVGGPVRRHVVDAAARREGDATLGEMRPDKLPNLVLQLLDDVDHELARLCDGPQVLPRRSMHFGRLAVFVQDGRHLPVRLSHLCGRRAVRVHSDVFADLAFREIALWEQVHGRNGRLGPCLLFHKCGFLGRLLLVLGRVRRAAGFHGHRHRRGGLQKAVLLHRLLDAIFGHCPAFVL